MSKKAEKTAQSNEFDVDMAVPLTALCLLCGISPNTGHRHVRDGLFISTAKRKNAFLYPLRENLLRFWSAKIEEAKDAAAPDDVEELKAQKLKAEIGLKQSQGELHQLKTAHAQGQYIAKEDIVLDLERFFVQMKKFMQALPARVGGTVAGYVDPVIERGIEKDIQEEINGMLQAFCDKAESYKPGGGSQ